MLLKDCVICVIGAGNMGSALIRGLAGNNLHVLEKNQDSLAKLEVPGLSFNAPNKPPDILVMAVKPQDMPVSLNEHKALAGKNTLLISVAAGLKLATVAQYLPASQPIVRAMPNVGAMVMRSVTAICANAQVSAAQLEVTRELFSKVGQWVEVEEKHMDAVTALSGSGPGFVALILEAMSDAGVAQGLPRNVALKLAIDTLTGAGELASQLKLHPAQLKDMVASPGGTTIAGITALEQGGLRGTIMRAVEAAARRSRELA